MKHLSSGHTYDGRPNFDEHMEQVYCEELGAPAAECTTEYDEADCERCKHYYDRLFKDGDIEAAYAGYPAGSGA